MNTDEEQEKTCPILHTNCLKEKCAWWMAHNKYCAIVEIAECIS
jgi:hypothetical protein